MSADHKTIQRPALGGKKKQKASKPFFFFFFPSAAPLVLCARMSPHKKLICRQTETPFFFFFFSSFSSLATEKEKEEEEEEEKLHHRAACLVRKRSLGRASTRKNTGGKCVRARRSCLSKKEKGGAPPPFFFLGLRILFLRPHHLLGETPVRMGNNVVWPLLPLHPFSCWILSTNYIRHFGVMLHFPHQIGPREACTPFCVRLFFCSHTLCVRSCSLSLSLFLREEKEALTTFLLSSSFRGVWEGKAATKAPVCRDII